MCFDCLLLFVCCCYLLGHIAEALIVGIIDFPSDMQSVKDEEIERTVLGRVLVDAIALQGHEHLLGHDGRCLLGCYGLSPTPLQS